MLRKCEQSGQGRRGTSPGEAPRQARHVQAPAPALASRVYIRAGRAGKLELEAGAGLYTYVKRAGKLKGDRTMMCVIGCGLMLAGLLTGALFGSMLIALTVIGIGSLFVLAAIVEEKQKKKQAQAWRATYPPYGY